MAYKNLSIILILLVFGCGYSQRGGSYRVNPAFKGFESRAKIAVILNDISSKNSAILEKKLNESIQASFEDLNANIKMIPPDEVRKLAMPNYMSDKSAAIEWHKIINNNAFRDRIGSLSLKYIILIESKLKSVESWKSEANDEWNYFSFYRSQIHLTGLLAKIIDLSESRQVAEAQSDAVEEGRYGLGVLSELSYNSAFVIPFPIISPAEDDVALAGKELARHIAALFTTPRFKKINDVKSAVKQENGDIEICVELEDSNGRVSSEPYTINLPLSSLKDGATDFETLGFREEGCKGTIVYSGIDRRKYCTDDIIFYLYPIEKAKKGCDKILLGSLTSESILSIEKVIVDLEKISRLSNLLNSQNEEHPYLERVYEVTFVSNEEGIAAEKEKDETKDQLAKRPQEIRLIYFPPQIAQEASFVPIFPIGFAGVYDRED